MVSAHRKLVNRYREILKQYMDIDSDLVILSIIEETQKALTDEHISAKQIDGSCTDGYYPQYFRILNTHNSIVDKKYNGAISQ